MKIEIICGSYGWRKTKDAMPKLVERGGICEVDEAEARRLVALGVAAIVHEADEAPVASGSTVESGDTPCVDMPCEENGAESDAEAHLDAEQLQEMTVAQLKELAADLGIETAVGNYRNLEDDVVDFYSSALKTNESKNLTVSCIGTATLPDAKCVDDVMRTNITFQLEDKSQGKSMTYVPVDGEGITADGKVKILSADIEETEVGDYVTIHCIFLEECDSISLDVMDLNGNLWQLSDLGGGSEVAEVGKEATFQISYQKTDLADEIGIRGYDYETNTAYELVKMKLKE